MNKSRREADDTMVQLVEEKKNTEYIAQESEIELEKVRLDACVSTRVKSQSLTRRDVLFACLNFRFFPLLFESRIFWLYYTILWAIGWVMGKISLLFIILLLTYELLLLSIVLCCVVFVYTKHD